MADAPACLRDSGTNAQGFQEFTNEKDQTVLVRIPGGTFQMGSNERDEEKPPHSVTLPAYLLARVPVTNAQFARFVATTGHDAGSFWRQFASKWGDQASVVCVSWNDATAYCTWAGLRLPTEEEWELGARGTEGYTYPWGNDWDASRCKNSMDTSSDGAAPVGSFPTGASPFGCLDMVGNVWHWTSSWYDRYPGSTTSNNQFGQKYRVLRGGAANTYTYPSYFRGACRSGLCTDNRVNFTGYRCARSVMCDN